MVADKVSSANMAAVFQGSICSFTATGSLSNADLDSKLWAQLVSTRKVNFTGLRHPGAYKHVLPSPLYNRCTQLLAPAATDWPIRAHRSLPVKALTSIFPTRTIGTLSDWLSTLGRNPELCEYHVVRFSVCGGSYRVFLNPNNLRLLLRIRF